MLTVALLYVNSSVTFIATTDISYQNNNNNDNKYFLTFDLPPKEINTETKKGRQKERQSIMETESRKEREYVRQKERRKYKKERKKET
jgi:hypothetical protein